MSLSSKELFHSNFWGWLFERSIEYVKVFFPAVTPDSDYIVERETGSRGNKRDLTVRQNPVKNKNGKTIRYDKAFVIENKFKSLPRKEQLERYQKDLNSQFVGGVITGINKPDFIDSLENWKFIPYGEIASAILDVAKKEAEGFEKELIVKYAELICQLNAFIISTLKDTYGKWSIKAISTKASKLRINDVLLKLKASELCSYIQKHIDLPKRVGSYELIIADGFSHAHPIVDVRYVQTKDKSIPSVFGIQIENLQFRRCVQSMEILDPVETEKFFRETVSCGWFEDYTKESKNRIQGKKTSMRKTFGTYQGLDDNKNPYTFIHQYWNIENDLSFDEILKHIHNAVQYAISVFVKDNKKD